MLTDAVGLLGALGTLLLLLTLVVNRATALIRAAARCVLAWRSLKRVLRGPRWPTRRRR